MIKKELFKITFKHVNVLKKDYEALKEYFPNLKPNDLEHFRECYEVRQLPEEARDARAEELYVKYLADNPDSYSFDYTSHEAMIDPVVFPFHLMKYCEVGPSTTVEYVVKPDLTGFIELAERLENAAKIANTFNEKVNVHIGGSTLMTVNDLTLLEEACTDALQSALDKGWRIIACCVQPDGRRPDYVLGRWNPDKESRGNGAGRNV